MNGNGILFLWKNKKNGNGIDPYETGRNSHMVPKITFITNSTPIKPNLCEETKQKISSGRYIRLTY